jgi:hypothetical protein
MNARPARPSALAALILAVCVSTPADAHRAGLDPYGCHPDAKAGGYHCHQGVLANLRFPSRGDMLDAIDNGRRSPVAPPAAPRASPPVPNTLTDCTESADEAAQHACFERITRPRD